eukprot:6194176-Pleurochrysis_carterae.AAC.1
MLGQLGAVIGGEMDRTSSEACDLPERQGLGKGRMEGGPSLVACDSASTHAQNGATRSISVWAIMHVPTFREKPALYPHAVRNQVTLHSLPALHAGVRACRAQCPSAATPRPSPSPC